MFKLLITLLIGVLPLSGKPSKAQIRDAFELADAKADSSMMCFSIAYQNLFEKQEEGLKDVEKEFWFKNVEPYLVIAADFMGEAVEAIDSVLPKTINRKDEFWSKAYFDVRQDFELTRKHMEDPSLYKSDYLVVLGGYPSFMSMYLAVIVNNFERVKGDREKLSELIGQLQ